MPLLKRLGKKAAIGPTDWFFILLYITTFALLLIPLVFSIDSIIESRLKTHNLPYYELDLRILKALSLYSGRAHFGLIDLDKYNEMHLMKVISRYHFPEEYELKIGIRVMLTNLETGEQDTLYYDKEFYEDAVPLARFKYALIKNKHPVRIHVADGKPVPASLSVDVVGRPT
jgi:hypothetical protein